MKKPRDPPKRKGTALDSEACAPKMKKKEPLGTSHEGISNPFSASSPTLPDEETAAAPDAETTPPAVANDFEVTPAENQPAPGLSFDLGTVKCPESWYLKQGDSGSFFLFEIRIIGDNPTPLKSMKVEHITGEIFFRVCGRDLLLSPDHLYVSQDIFRQLPRSVCSVDELNVAIQNFNNFKLCEGISDSKYHQLQDLPIESGIFERNAWYSKRYKLKSFLSTIF